MAIEGKTYSLHGGNDDSEQYYETIKNLADLLIELFPDTNRLLSLIRNAGRGNPIRRWLRIRSFQAETIGDIGAQLKGSLSVYTQMVESHLRSLSLRKRFDDTISAKEAQYHLYMLEIELVNRVYSEQFQQSDYKFALMAHCLRDFRPSCRSEPGEIEAVCKGCTDNCQLNLAGELLRRHDIDPYISVEIEQEKVLAKLKRESPRIGALGIACVPELARGMRLCISLGIPPVGVPLDANRCRRWMGKAHETSFNMRQLNKLLG